MRFSALATLALVAAPLFAEQPPPVLRKAPELEVVEASGKKSLLSQFRGKVCVVEFMFTTCPHCQVTSQMYNKIYTDLKGSGFQALAVAFNEPLNPMILQRFVQEFGITFPVGIGSRGTQEHSPANTPMQLQLVV